MLITRNIIINDKNGYYRRRRRLFFYSGHMESISFVVKKTGMEYNYSYFSRRRQTAEVLL